MNELEKIALERMKEEVCRIKEMTGEKNKEYMNDQRLWIKKSADKIFDIIKAMEDNGNNR